MSVQRWAMSTVHGHTDDEGEWVTYADHVAALAEAERRHPDIPIQGEHDPMCFPAIRDVRIGDWGSSCFTCQVISMVRVEALRQAREVVIAECIAHHGYTPGQTCPYCTDALAAIAAPRGES